MGTSIMRKRIPLGPNSRTMPRGLWEVAVSYKRGTPGKVRGYELHKGIPLHPEVLLQGYLAHKKQPPPRTLQ